jgi:small-conductance mechanosensitive channel/CRP-like cAMP-binding protein
VSSALRRLAVPLILLAVVAAAVWAAGALGIPTSSPGAPGGTRDYGKLAIGIAAAVLAIRILDLIFFEAVPRVRGRSPAPALLRQLAALLLFGLALALLFQATLSMSLTAVLVPSAIITAVIGLALQDTLGNLFAGLGLAMERSVTAGDVIQTGGVYGVVEQLSWRSIRLRTPEGNLLLLPNSIASRERLEIFPRGRPIARRLLVELEYDESPERARVAMESAIRGVSGVAVRPEPTADLRGFQASGVLYELRYWLEDYSRFLEIDALVHERVWYALSRASISHAYAVIRQHQYAGGPLAKARPPADAAAAISGLDLFGALSPEERTALTAGAAVLRFGPGEIVVREGEPGDSMFLIASGTLNVSVHGEGDSSQRVAALGPGQSFGEQSLLTGDVRNATVRAAGEAVLIEIEKQDLAPVLAANPSLCGALEKIMTERRQYSADVLSSRPAAAAHERHDLAGRIARFFGLRPRGGSA